MKLRLIYTCFVIVALLFSCIDNKKKNNESHDSEAELIGDNSMTSLDWAGTYEGILPCADCEGIKTVISINQDNTYFSKEIYEGKKDSLFESKGTFQWDENGQIITLSDSKRHSYFVGENTLTHLDKDGNKISGNLAKRYILKKVKDELAGKKWHLVSFKGEEIKYKEAKAEHAYVEFLEDFTLIGYTGCNNLQGGYTLEDGQKIKFSKLISTKKFCPEIDTENEFLNVLGKAVNYEFKDHVLIIHDAEHNVLAHFKVAN